jgi:hypothetical protein
MISGCCITDDDNLCLEVDSEAIFSEEAEVQFVVDFLKMAMLFVAGEGFRSYFQFFFDLQQ